MKGSLRQRTRGSWELTIELGKDALGKRWRKYVTVQGNKTWARRKLRELLTAVERGIMLDIGTSKVLREQRAAQERLKATMGASLRRHGARVHQADGRVGEPHAADERYRPAWRVRRRANKTVRSLRHFHASVALQTGQNIIVVSKRLGHSNVGHLRALASRLVETGGGCVRGGDGGGRWRQRDPQRVLRQAREAFEKLRANENRQPPRLI